MKHKGDTAIDNLSAAFGRMLIALYAAEKWAVTLEDREEAARAVRMSEAMEAEAMAAFGRDSVAPLLRQLVRETGDLAAIRRYLTMPDRTRSHHYA